MTGAMALAGCGSAGEAPKEEPPSQQEPKDDRAGDAGEQDDQGGKDAKDEDAGTTGDEHGEAVGMANPWKDAATAQDAAAEAGMDSFSVPDGYDAGGLGRLEKPEFRSTQGIVEAAYHVRGGDLFIRKGIGVFADGEEHDLSGDYTEQPVEWQADNLGIAVRCWGPEDGRARRAVWDSGEVSYSILLVPDEGGNATIARNDLMPLVLEVF